MRTVFLHCLSVIASSTIAVAAPTSAEPRCAFADESFVTMFAISTAITEYYVSHRAWPVTKLQLRSQLIQIARALPPPDKPSSRDIDQLLSRFSRIDLQPRGRDLVLAVDYRAEGKRHVQRILFPAGRSTDEILQASRELK